MKFPWQSAQNLASALPSLREMPPSLCAAPPCTQGTPCQRQCSRPGAWFCRIPDWLAACFAAGQVTTWVAELIGSLSHGLSFGQAGGRAGRQANWAGRKKAGGQMGDPDREPVFDLQPCDDFPKGHDTAL